jgi:hypothetical protein
MKFLFSRLRFGVTLRRASLSSTFSFPFEILGGALFLAALTGLCFSAVLRNQRNPK